MRILFFVMVSFCGMVAMEAPQASQEQARVAPPKNYVLQGEKGDPISFDGQMIRDLLPGLADTFTKGMIEEKTGTIAIHDLDQTGLQVLKRGLQAIYPLQQKYIKGRQDIITRARNKAEAIVYPDDQKERENAERNKVFQDANKQENDLVTELAQQAKVVLEQLPSIGEYFLDIFNNLVVWRAALLLEVSLGKFAADHIDFGDDAQYEQLQLLDPRAQLIYLFEVPLTVNTTLRAFNWLKELVHKPDIRTQGQSLPFLDGIARKFGEFINQNIEAVMRTYPQFPELIKDPAFGPVATSLEFLLKHNPHIAYEKTIFTSNQGIPKVVDLENTGFGVDDGVILHIFDRASHVPIRWISLNMMISNREDKYTIIGSYLPGLIAVYQLDDVILYDLVSDQQILNFGYMGQVRVNTAKIFDRNSFLIANERRGIRIANRKEQKSFNRGPLDGTFSDVLVFDATHVLLHTLDGTLVAWFPNTRLQPTILHREQRNGQAASGGMDKIGQTQAVAYLYDDNFIPNFYLIDAFKNTINDLGRVNYKETAPPLLREILVLNQDHFLVHNGDLWSISHKAFDRFINVPLESVIALDHNRVAYVARNSKNVIIKFVPQASTLAQIFDAIKRHIASEPGQPQPQKRSASVEPEDRPIPAAAQPVPGLRPAAAEGKRQRLEKPNG